ncbi:hypothetical protein [Streptomyces hebeiensis]
MPLNPRDRQRRDNLVKAAQVLRSTPEHADLADDIDYVLSPDGALFVNRLRKHGEADAGGPKTEQPDNMPIRIPEDRLKVLQQGRKDGVNLTEVVENGFRDWLTGKFELRLEPRAKRGSAPTSGIVNIRPHQDLQDTVAAKCERVRAERAGTGQTGAVYPTTVAAHCLYAYFQIGPYAPDTDRPE